MATRLTINGHDYLITDTDGVAEIRGAKQSRSYRHRRMSAVQRVTVAHEGSGASVTGDANLELAVEHVED